MSVAMQWFVGYAALSAFGGLLLSDAARLTEKHPVETASAWVAVKVVAGGVCGIGFTAGGFVCLVKMVLA